MSRFKFKDFIFGTLPTFIQENDSYKDSSGKGILQRFMSVCSEYFDTDIIDNSSTYYEGDKPQPGLENILDIIDVDKTPALFLNYIWEFLGEIPLAYGLIIRDKVYNKDDLEGWLKPNELLPELNPRELLRYAISLYKIRGTAQFYEILSKFYGVRFLLIETHNGGDPGEEETEPNHDHLVLAVYPDSDDGTRATYPLGTDSIRAPFWDGSCTSCLYFILYIDLVPEDYQRIVEQGKEEALKDTLRSIVEKYLPIHCSIGKYNSGDYKVVLRIGSDFSNDFNNDFL